MKLEISAFELAQRFVGVKEVQGKVANPAILAMLHLDASWPEDDAVPWCSGFVNYVCWLLRLPRSKSLRARSWLEIGAAVALSDAQVGFDIVILNRGGPADPAILAAPGHVGFFAGAEGPKGLSPDRLGTFRILVLGGNQSDGVNVAAFDANDILGIRRLWG